MADIQTLAARVFGRVQGVGFRDFVLEEAVSLGLKGYVRNAEPYNTVEVVAEGERPKLELLLNRLRAGPPLAQVESVQVFWSESHGVYEEFRVRC